MAGQKISERPALTGSIADKTKVIIPTSDLNAVGNAQNKTISLAKIAAELGGGAGVTDVTHAQLINKMDNNELVAGSWYRITDFRTVNYVHGADFVMNSSLFDINIGNTEPLLVFAIKNNEISSVAYSEQFPDDIIYYQPRVLSVYPSLIDNVNTNVDNRGVIVRRIDTKHNVSVPFDFRNEKYRRYTNNSGKYVLLKDDDNTGVYRDKLSFKAPSFEDNVFNIDWKGSLRIIDLKGVYNSLSGIYFGNNYNSNNIIVGNFSGDTIGDNFYNNTIGDNFSDNTIGDYFNYNTIGDYFNNNTIGDYFNYNTIGDNFNYNTIGDYFNYNTIGDYFYSNTVGDNFYNNTVENNFYNNTIGDNFSDNTIGDNFKYNITKTPINTTVDFTSATHVYQEYTCEIIKNANGDIKLKYYNASDVLTSVDITN